MTGRTTWYESGEEMQTDLDEHLDLYNTERPHRGRKINEKTPSLSSRPVSAKPSRPPPTSNPKENQQAAQDSSPVGRMSGEYCTFTRRTDMGKSSAHPHLGQRTWATPESTAVHW